MIDGIALGSFGMASRRAHVLRRRRAIAVVASLGLADALAIALFQVGVVRHLPDPPGFDSDGVTGSPSAYPGGIPDGALAALQLSTVLVLSAAPGALGRRPRRIAGVLLGLAAGAGGAAATLNLWKMVVREGRLCAWCLPLALANGALVALAVPDAVRALRG
jgi:uncharacterized membrane protein